MICLSCKKDLAGGHALWNNRLLLCAGCVPKADRAQAELELALERARLQAAMFLEQFILRGGLVVPNSGMELPGLGKGAP